jgi:hypothetical protein
MAQSQKDAAIDFLKLVASGKVRDAYRKQQIHDAAAPAGSAAA